MTFDWKEFLAVAKALAVTGATEAQLRTAISRAYYAAFHEALKKARVEQLGDVDRPGDDTHRRVWDAFDNTEEREGKAIAVRGKELKMNRVDADYKTHSTPNLKHAAFAIKKAEEILSNLERAHRLTPRR